MLKNRRFASALARLADMAPLKISITEMSRNSGFRREMSRECQSPSDMQKQVCYFSDKLGAQRKYIANRILFKHFRSTALFSLFSLSHCDTQVSNYYANTYVTLLRAWNICNNISTHLLNQNCWQLLQTSWHSNRRNMLKTLIFLLLVNFASSKLTWRLISAKNDSDEFPSPRRDSSIGFLRTTNQLVIFGGKGSGGNLDDTWIFDLQTGSWRRLENLNRVPHKRFSMAYGAAENSFYISTGEYSGSPRTFFNDIWKFDLTAGGRWERLDDENAEVKPEVRYGSAGGIFDDGSGNNGFYITHGFSETRYSNTFKFDFGQRKWVEKFSGSNNYDPKYPHSRCLHGGTLTNPDEIVMYGGCLGWVHVV